MTNDTWLRAVHDYRLGVYFRANRLCQHHTVQLLRRRTALGCVSFGIAAPSACSSASAAVASFCASVIAGTHHMRRDLDLRDPRLELPHLRRHLR